MFSEMDITEREKVRARLDKRNERDQKRRKLETVEQRQAKLAKRNESDRARTKKRDRKKNITSVLQQSSLAEESVQDKHIRSV